MAGLGPGGGACQAGWRAGRPDAAPAPDLVGRNFDRNGPDRTWGADMTQFRTEEGWLYLATVVDLYHRRVIGWAMASSPTPTSSSTPSYGLRAPATRPRVCPSLRPRRGLYLAGLREAPRISGSPSRSAPPVTASTTPPSKPCGPRSSGSWLDPRRRSWPSRDLLRSAIFDYVEGFYNPQRTQNASAIALPQSSKKRQWLKQTVSTEAGQYQEPGI